jgi:hypothetical protein
MAPLLRSAAAQIGAVAAAECTGALLTSFATANVSSLNPSVLVRPVAVTVDNLHPVPFPGMAIVSGAFSFPCRPRLGRWDCVACARSCLCAAGSDCGTDHAAPRHCGY